MNHSPDDIVDPPLAAFQEHLSSSASATEQLRTWSGGDVRLGRTRRSIGVARPSESTVTASPSRSVVQRRRVELLSENGELLSEAFAVVVLSRLPMEAVSALQFTRTPLGDVLRAAGTLDRTLLRETVRPSPRVVLRKVSVLLLDDRPVAAVHESYPPHVLGREWIARAAA